MIHLGLLIGPIICLMFRALSFDSDSAKAKHQERGAVGDLAAFFFPFHVSGHLIFRHRAIAEERGGRSFKSPICKSHVRHAHMQRTRLGQRTLSRLDIREKFFVGEQVPCWPMLALFDGEHAKQTEAAFELEYQVIAR